jgi:hypothetical protein
MSEAFFIFILLEGLAGRQYQVLAELNQADTDLSD